ncbi:hypothetical protein BDZ89DRAFT_695717 [Hymenopellis radicata]|nr:hypothetical protein BDZ89DRAFT_695717 [Hymenopellis radicata]
MGSSLVAALLRGAGPGLKAKDVVRSLDSNELTYSLLAGHTRRCQDVRTNLRRAELTPPFSQYPAVTFSAISRATPNPILDELSGDNNAKKADTKANVPHIFASRRATSRCSKLKDPFPFGGAAWLARGEGNWLHLSVGTWEP